ncbi:hypothetical protein CKM354_000119200 [Cercospora kikuchii]|uniref:Uncharacterized protein n=1 Tax=Cercospora kikuchii TaxID=84275 RepID=A0A9P3F809_9PEZI|nr:uncharacterized protein CKM354_000119200 [Cercospora kikuchii]GIZ37756.1 hypothetical protein CKM354_000119200 [Cercospora kikuchii]
MTLVLSENLVACITFSAKLYVQALDDEGGSQKTIRLPSAAVSTFHADGNCLALTTTDYSGSTSLLLIYDHLTRRAVQHTVEHPRAAVSENCTLNSVTFAAEMHRPTSYEWSGPSSVLVGEEQGTFDLFYESYGESTPGTDEHQVYRVHLVHQRYHISPASAQLPNLFHKQSEQILLLLTTPFLTSMDLGRRICILGAPRPTGSPGQWYFGRYLLDVNQAERWSSHHVPTFDAATGVLSTKDYYLPTSPRKKPNPGRLMTNSRITQLYSIEGYKHQIHPLLNTFSIGGTHSCAAVRTSGVFDEEVFDQEVFDQESHIQGVEMNDSFQIMSLRKGGRDSIRVWCFEPGLHWKSDRTTRVRGNDLRRLCVNILRRV